MHSPKTLQYKKEHYNNIYKKRDTLILSAVLLACRQNNKNIKHPRHASFSSKLFLLYSLACFNMSKNV
ncbi:hypothetical protein HMPREF1199_02462, partial [Hoylesella oralis CC98A]